MSMITAKKMKTPGAFYFPQSNSYMFHRLHINLFNSMDCVQSQQLQNLKLYIKMYAVQLFPFSYKAYTCAYLQQIFDKVDKTKNK